MARGSRKAARAFWERGYLSHGYWLGKTRLGIVRLGPKNEWDGIYRWEAGDQAGEAATLGDAKRAVEQAALTGASQLPLFGKSQSQ
jgi:hypothetical protein